VLAAHLRTVPGGLLSAASSVAQIGSMAKQQQAIVIGAYRAGLSGAFIVGAVIAALGFVVVLFLPELPLRASRGDEEQVDG